MMTLFKCMDQNKESSDNKENIESKEEDVKLEYDKKTIMLEWNARRRFF